MLDKRTGILLSFINETCKEGGYEVIERGEIFEKFERKIPIDEQTLNHCLNYLEENKFIDVRYKDDNLICVCPLPSGRYYFEREREAEFQRETDRKKLFLLCALSSFVAGFFSSFVAALIVHFI